MNSAKSLPKIYIALPVLNELTLLPRILSDLISQTIQPEEVVLCVNQPDNWWSDPDKKQICKANQDCISLITMETRIKINLIDRSSIGLGWQGKHCGVGWARKTTMDLIAQKAADHDIIISLDADTTFGTDYLQSVAKNLIEHPTATGLSIPYYHDLTGEDNTLDRAILRYEIYMRCYSINLLQIGSPYSFTALGSAIAMPVWAYKAIGGITPQKSGEDFYLLQKLRKLGPLLFWNEEKVYPATRLSDRVFFGTGPALIKGLKGDWDSYPIYSLLHFDEVRKTYDLFTHLFREDVQTPMTFFLEIVFGPYFWQPLRKNSRSLKSFVKACHQKIDALRILQYLKWREHQEPGIASERLIEMINRLSTDVEYNKGLPEMNNFSFEKSPIIQVNEIRDFLVRKEETLQRSHTENFKSIVSE
jgi:hypothetical protein